MCALYGLIASGVTRVHRNCVCVIVRACACVGIRAGGLAYVCLRGENSILMHNYFIYKNVYDYIA